MKRKKKRKIEKKTRRDKHFQWNCPVLFVLLYCCVLNIVTAYSTPSILYTKFHLFKDVKWAFRSTYLFCYHDWYRAVAFIVMVFENYPLNCHGKTIFAQCFTYFTSTLINYSVFLSNTIEWSLLPSFAIHRNPNGFHN